MSGKPKISVCSQIYNTAEPLLRKAIESVLNQTFRDFEYLIIDNGCTDQTREILADYALNDERIHITRYEDNSVIYYKGIEETTRRADGLLSMCSGLYVCWMDSDDWYETDFFEEAYRLAVENDADMVIGGLKFWSENSETVATFVCPKGVYSGNDDIAKIWIDGYRFFRGNWGKIVRVSLWQRYFSKMGIAGNFSDCYVNQCCVGDSKVIVATDKIAYNWLSRNDSDSTRMSAAVLIIDRSVVLYMHNLEILSKLNAVTQERLNFFKTIFRAGLLHDDFRPLERAKDLQPAEVMRKLEKLVTDETVRQAFPNFDTEDDALKKIFDLACYIQAVHANKKKASIGFLADMARIWASSGQLKNATANELKTFAAAVYHKNNMHRFGEGLLPGAFRDYHEANPKSETAMLGDEFCRKFPYETSLLFHGRVDKAFDELERKYGEASDVAALDSISDGELRVAMLAGDGELFVNLRRRRAEMFANAGIADKAAMENVLIANILEESEAHK